MSSTLRATTSQPRSLLSIARLNIARSRLRSATWSLVRTDQTCFGRSGGLVPTSLPLFQGPRLSEAATEASLSCMVILLVGENGQHAPTHALRSRISVRLGSRTGRRRASRSVAESGRVEMWRGCCRPNISVSASFVWRCLSGSTVTPFPHPAHRTGRADLPHPALGQDLTPLLSRATPSAVSEPFAEFIVAQAPSLSLAGFRLVVALTTPWGFPCCVRFPCVLAAATTPAQRLGVLFRSVTQPCQPSPKGLSGRPAHCPFRGLLSVHSRCGLHTRAVTNS